MVEGKEVISDRVVGGERGNTIREVRDVIRVSATTGSAVEELGIHISNLQPMNPGSLLPFNLFLQTKLFVSTFEERPQKAFMVSQSPSFLSSVEPVQPRVTTCGLLFDR